MPVYRVSRGGQVTYHGPGQLVGYPILKLEGAARDVHGYLRSLEQVLIDALARCGIAAGRRERLTGVWVGHAQDRVARRGYPAMDDASRIRVNVATDLSYFDAIVPCGIEGCVMTSLRRSRRWVGPIVSRATASPMIVQRTIRRTRV